MRVYRIDIAKLGKDKIYKSIHVMATNPLHAGHIAVDLVYEGEMFDIPVDIIGINKERKIKEIINADNDEFDEDEQPDLDFPYRIIEQDKDFPESMKVEFKHNCGNVQKIGLFDWGKMECRDCHKIIKREQIEEVGGIYLFVEDK